MNKEINYLIEYLAKSNEHENSDFYKSILSFFQDHLIYSSSKYEIKTLKVLAIKGGIIFPESFEDALTKLDKLLESNTNNEIIEAKKQLLDTIVSSNFKKKKEHFDKVETSIYKTLIAYIAGLTRALEIFYMYTKNDVKEPEVYIEFSNKIHAELIEMIFNKEEKALLADKLKEIMSVYLSVYARYLYM
ncbi:hypothetical protein [Sulfurospirillum arcachonense]|uniref:hypothetical protein n=1 Tax=Sulfurospirillum arcachonense TaxID=57666 RepID=UPI00046ABA24|nr:hypothetical protein [Sulfurospirillum arcachonense]